MDPKSMNYGVMVFYSYCGGGVYGSVDVCAV